MPTPTTPDASTTEAASRRYRLFAYAVLISLAAGSVLAGIVNAEPLQSANDRSRWCTVWSLVERGTYRIDEIIERPSWDTIDKVRWQGHFYSTKPALLPTLVAGVYWSVQQTTGWDLLGDTNAAARLVLVIVNLLPFVAALCVAACLVERYAKTDAARFFVMAALSLATLITTFSVTLNNHTVAAVSAILALYPALRIVIDGTDCPGCFAAAGFFAAFTSTNELPAAAFGAVLFGLLVWKNPRRTLLCFVPAAAIPLAAFFATTYLATGTWKPFYLFFGSDPAENPYLYVHEGVPSYWMNPRGLDANEEPTLVYLLHCTFGHHGIFSLSPIFLFSVLGWATLRRWRAHPLRPFLWFGLGLTIVVLGFYLTRTGSYNYGGTTSGLRWLIWLIPFWLVALIPVFDEWGRRWSLRIPAVLLLVVSTFSAWYPLPNPWQHPWLFTLMEDAGWVDYEEPPPKLERPLWTWFRSLPEVEDSAQPVWIEFAGPGPSGDVERLRLIAHGMEETNEGPLYRLDVVRRKNGGEEERTAYDIDAAAFRAGKPPTEYLRWPAGEPDETERVAAIRFLHGLPALRRYEGGRIRYLETALQDEALRCHRAASRVAYKPGGSSAPFLYRTDLWLCEDVPFGVVRVEHTVYGPRMGGVINKRVLQAVAASGFK